VDVVVTDSKDEPVTGLGKKDFEISEDGKPQTISTFEEHKGVRINAAKLPPMPPDVYTNFNGSGQGCVNQPATPPFTWSAPNFDRLDLGWESYQIDGVRTIHVDDVVISKTQVGCPAN